MTTIAELARKDTRAGSNRSWHSHTYREKGNQYREVWHYSTLMLRYSTDSGTKWDGNLNTVYVSTGHGSVSDQGGLNQLFRALGMPLYYSRAGGAVIEHLRRTGYGRNAHYNREVFTR